MRLEGAGELPDSTYEEAARLAAYYSSGRTAPKVEIDYTERRNIKKPAGAKPGFVIYHTNYSMIAEPRIAGIEDLLLLHFSVFWHRQFLTFHIHQESEFLKADIVR